MSRFSLLAACLALSVAAAAAAETPEEVTLQYFAALQEGGFASALRGSLAQ